MAPTRDPVDFYRRCLKWVIDSGRQEWIDYFRRLNPKDIDKQAFFLEYLQVVLASGFKWSIVDEYKEYLADPLCEFDVSRIARSPENARTQALLVFRHAGKINAIVDTAVRLSNWTPHEFEEFMDLVQMLDSSRVSRMLQTFPYIGPVTQFHLARNIGLNFPKPDVHMKRAAAICGYPPTEDGVFQFVRDIARATGEREGVIDFVVWKYMESHGHCCPT